eukprot:CAMPEP_0194527898 /NCGR_PEP_ID=MMETSP0253-20130528/64145_1 /TAXON_ID=2966 /ORGANISM="Noctiluca scintillans" /LENGTH=354 /DNA_ID=CAMNT_0039372895 /DNA_START=20 /DNA_END=1081 /DNA_ORIENTATION=+
MADRICLTVTAGGKQSHRIAIDDLEQWEEGVKQCPGRRLGSLHWSTHIHDGQLLDVEVLAFLDTVSEEAVVLQERTRGTKFTGVFQPEDDDRFPSDVDVSAVVFNFSNEFAWLGEKKVELILVHRSGGLPRALVPALPQMSAVPRMSRSSHLVGRTPSPAGAPLVPSLLATSVCPAHSKLGSFAGTADTLLAAIEAARPEGAAEQWVGDLLLGVSRLRSFCEAHAHGMEGTSVKRPGAHSAPPSRKLQLASPSRPSRGRTISGRYKAVRTLQSTSENKVGVLAAPDMRADVLNYLLPGESFTVSEELVIEGRRFFRLADGQGFVSERSRKDVEKIVVAPVDMEVKNHPDASDFP